MTLRIINQPASEPVTPAEVTRWARIDAKNQELAPGAFTVALAGAGAGNVDNGAHRYLAVFVTATGKTQAGDVTAAVTVADKAVNGKVALSAIPLGGALVTARELYRTAAGGSTYLYLATLADNTTTVYVDNIADAALGVEAPSVNTTGDPLLALLITAARKVAEVRTGRALITQTWEQVLDAFPARGVELNALPIQVIDSVKYYDTEGVLQTLDPSAYTVDDDTLPGWLLPAYDTEWPDTLDTAQAVRIRMTVGYGATGASVPEEIRAWISAQVAASYDAPDGLMDGRAVSLPFIDGLLDPYRIRGLG